MTVFVTKGNKPLTPVQLEKRAQKYITRSWPEANREQSIRNNDGLFTAFMVGFSEDHTINTTNNTFNWDLSQYQTATTRLTRYVLSVGRLAIFEDQETGEFDEEGNAITASVLIQSAIEPLPSTVIITVFNEETETSSEQEVPNPLIEADDAERDQATAIVTATPTEVKNF
jgi:hypothetical protein